MGEDTKSVATIEETEETASVKVSCGLVLCFTFLVWLIACMQVAIKVQPIASNFIATACRYILYSLHAWSSIGGAFFSC